MMNAGHLDRKVMIRHRVSTGNTFGDSADSYADLKPAWAKYQPMAGSERWAADGNHTVKSAKFTVYFDSTINETMQLHFDNLLWNITGLAELGYRHLLEITAEVIK